ncbi:glutamyl-tRNA reductase [Chloroflexi bacterium TSY]|nr:glutamyl-tRNA reductase [Chloroflexi bacterium TSY]
MSILLFGLNHKTAPVTLREKLSLAGAELQATLDHFRQTYRRAEQESINAPLHEVVILSTCNRFEVYAVGHEEIEQDKRSLQSQEWSKSVCELINFVADSTNISVQELQPHLYIKYDQGAVVHLFRVVSGLDSLILGEPQILGQVREAYTEAHAAGTTGATLSQLFRQAVHTGKRARTETEIARHTTSVSHAAGRLAQQQVGSLTTRNILIVGAGEMAGLAAQAIHMQGARNISIINRTYASAVDLAQRVDGQAAGWVNLQERLQEADVVISATGAPHTVLHREEVEPSLRARNGRPLVIIDIAVPRDIEESVAELPTVTCFDVDDLQSALDENMAQRRAEVPKVEEIIEVEANLFADWLAERQVVPVIVELRRRAKSIANAEVDQALRRLRNADIQAYEVAEDAIERLAHRLVNKLLHQPIVHLKERAAQGDGHEYAHMMRDLFELSGAQESREELAQTLLARTQTRADADELAHIHSIEELFDGVADEFSIAKAVPVG